MTSRAFAQTSGIKECTLQYWKRRMKDLSAGNVPPRFVEVSQRPVGQHGVDAALTVTVCDVRVSFSTLPGAAWFGELLHSLRPR
jgi:hypothetical protein